MIEDFEIDFIVVNILDNIYYEYVGMVFEVGKNVVVEKLFIFIIK